MSLRLRYLASALDDLEAIADYIEAETGDSVTGDRFTGRLRARCRKLATLPDTLGTERSDLQVDIRSTPSDGYVIYFRYTSDTIEVINVLHASRDAEAHFQG
jgi:toxin ParE1/3/4